MRKCILIVLLTIMCLGKEIFCQSPQLHIRSNLLPLPQPNFAAELEIQPISNFGIVVGGSTRNGLSEFGSLAWFRGVDRNCQAQTYSLLTGISYLHPFNGSLEVGGKLLYQYERSFLPNSTCAPEVPIHSFQTVEYIVDAHSVNVLPAARYFPTKRLFFEGAAGFGLRKGALNTGAVTSWIFYFPVQLNIGVRI